MVSSHRLTFADLELDRKTDLQGDHPINLIAKEFALFELFMRNQGKVLSLSFITEKGWDLDFDPGTNVIDVYVTFLRKKIDRDFERKLIHTKVGMGYIFDLEL